MTCDSQLFPFTKVIKMVLFNLKANKKFDLKGFNYVCAITIERFFQTNYFVNQKVSFSCK